MLKANDRICPFCKNCAEDELHVLLKCPLYAEICKVLLRKSIDTSIPLNALHENDMICFLFSQKKLWNLLQNPAHKYLNKGAIDYIVYNYVYTNLFHSSSVVCLSNWILCFTGVSIGFNFQLTRHG